MPTRLPTLFIPHGGGPWPALSVPFIPEAERATLTDYLGGIIAGLPERPRAVLMISAHWEERVPTLNTGARPGMLFDYSGFGPEAYALSWPAPGAPELAAEVQSLLQGAGFAVQTNATRGYDHGVFVPMLVMSPEADIPLCQLSLLNSLDAAQHLALGRALAPLRERGVLIVGSGNSYHNMRGFGHPGSTEPSHMFDAWLADTVQRSRAEREQLLADWKEAPAARACHPREEHLLPLHVVTGAAEDDAAALPLRGVFMRTHSLAVQFG